MKVVALLLAMICPTTVPQLRMMAEFACVADEPDGDLRAADVDPQRLVGHQCLWVLSG